MMRNSGSPVVARIRFKAASFSHEAAMLSADNTMPWRVQGQPPVRILLEMVHCVYFVVHLLWPRLVVAVYRANSPRRCNGRAVMGKVMVANCSKSLLYDRKMFLGAIESGGNDVGVAQGSHLRN